MSDKVIRFTAVMYPEQIERLDGVDDTNRAAATRRCIDRYFFIVENAMPSLRVKLSQEQIEVVADLFNNFGFSQQDLPLVPKHFGERVRMVLEARKSDVDDIEALIDKLNELSIDEKFALIHEAERRQQSRSRRNRRRGP